MYKITMVYKKHNKLMPIVGIIIILIYNLFNIMKY